MPHTEVVLQNEINDPQNIKDRFSIVVQAVYQQFDASPIALTIRAGRLIREEETPFVHPKLKLSKGQRVSLDFGHLGRALNCEVCIKNKEIEVETDPENPAPPYILIYQAGAQEPFGRLRPGRHAWIQPTCSYEIMAVGADAQLILHAFPE